MIVTERGTSKAFVIEMAATDGLPSRFLR